METKKFTIVLNTLFMSISVLGLLNHNLGDLNIKEKQIYIFKLLNHITELSFYEDVVEIANQFKIEDNLESYKNMELVKVFLRSLQKTERHPRGEPFCLFCEKQLKQAIRAFNVLYNAKDFATFLKTSCWLRQNINEGLFTYSFLTALRHREDCKNLIMPAIHEIYPFLFVTQSTANKAKILKISSKIINDGQFGIERIDIDSIAIIDKNNFYINEDYKVAYFTKDVGLNTYYYNFHLDYPFWMGDEIYGLTTDRRGELYIYMHRQLLARYYLERLSNGMCDEDTFEPTFPIASGIYPDTILHNGWTLPLRWNNFKIEKDKTKVLKEIHNFEQRLRDSIYNGFILSYDGPKIDMKKNEGIEVLGRRIYGNLDKTDSDLLYFYELMSRNLLSPEVNLNGIQMPTSVLQFYEMALQDPLFWNLQKSTMELVDKYQDNLGSFQSRDHLFFAGVNIQAVSVSKLVTYFENNDIDISNIVSISTEEEKLHTENLKIYARKTRLNNAGFDIKIDVISDKTVTSIVRIYLGPKNDCNGKKIYIDESAHSYVELDAFQYDLTVGNNSIIRKSKDFNNVIGNVDTTRKLFKDYDYKSDINLTTFLHRHTGFPHNLILPKGTKGGLPYSLFVMISSLEKHRDYSGFNREEMLSKKLCRFNLCIHSAPLGFPFNKKVDNEILYLPNIKFVDVIIFHKSKKEASITDTNLAVLPKQQLYY